MEQLLEQAYTLHETIVTTAPTMDPLTTLQALIAAADERFGKAPMSFEVLISAVYVAMKLLYQEADDDGATATD